MNPIFSRADVLLPQQKLMPLWSVVACDQFSAQPEYWDAVAQQVGSVPSALHLILPEARLGQPGEEETIEQIHSRMRQYCEQGMLEQYPDCYIYVERTLKSGVVRKGLIGKIDLEAYDYTEGAQSPIRCTEKTVIERIPPRMKVRENACLEMPHVLLLCDDAKKSLIEPITMQKDSLPLLYRFALMQGGGEVCGYLVQGEMAEAFETRLAAFTEEVEKACQKLNQPPLIFAVGDGNHSLATAKACYEKQKKSHLEAMHGAARYALVELENLHDEAQVFEPIHRLVMQTDAEVLLAALQESCCAETGYPLRYMTPQKSGLLYLDPAKGELAVGILQTFLDAYLQEKGGSIDYIHGETELKMLTERTQGIGFVLEAMKKEQLFRGVMFDGALPRKTFSMGEAEEKRYYLEARRID